MKKILLLEDDINLSKMIALALETYKYETVQVSTIFEAKEIIDEKSFDMLLFDVQIKNKKSFELASTIQDKYDIPIIFISALDDELNIVTALNLGGDDYITKPFSIAVLVSRIEAVLRRSSKNSFESVNSKSIILNLNHHQVSRNDELIELTVIEYKLLKCLMENAQRIVEKDTLMQAGWDESIYIDDNTVAVNIYRLRKKINTETEIIKTVRGLGYMFIEECVKR